nr:immunoglobulin light chain junction region [Macaca mulatta]MOX21777.1 immunoglobulin light chain junction region [Macaca mulatta]
DYYCQSFDSTGFVLL